MEKELIEYRDEKVDVDGVIISIDAEGDRSTSTMKIYSYRGDVSLMEEAIYNFAIDRGYDIVETEFC